MISRGLLDDASSILRGLHALLPLERELREALLQGPELRSCREALHERCSLPSGALLFVHLTQR